MSLLQPSVDQVRIVFDSQQLWILNLALALVMFGISLDIRVSDFNRLRKAPKAVFAGLASQFVLLPGLTFLLVYWLEPQPSFALGMILVASCPGGNVSNFMTHLAGGNTALSVSLTALATLLAVTMTPLNLEMWGGWYAPAAGILQEVDINFWEMVRLVALLLGLPLLLGMGIRGVRPAWADRLSPFFRVGSLLFFTGLVLFALWKDREVFYANVGLVFGIVVLHNALALLTGFGWARLMKLPRAETKTLTLETGIQNSGLGLMLIFTFFEGLGGMALVAAFWGIWHLVSGLLIAGFWSMPQAREQTARTP
ncbi:MAG TPA: bile acid:sodium symporter family protein [Robiginitalea sp.]|nr:bile acid:sodium symporter family protein [Robiginitalea sp.]